MYTELLLVGNYVSTKGSRRSAKNFEIWLKGNKVGKCWYMMRYILAKYFAVTSNMTLYFYNVFISELLTDAWILDFLYDFVCTK